MASLACVRFTIGSLVITSKMVDGTFPDYNRVIPRGNEKRLTIARKALDTAIEQVSVISSDRARAVKFSIDAGKVTLAVHDFDSGTATMDVPADYDNVDQHSGEIKEAEPLEIGFNSSYVRAMLGIIDGETVEMRLADMGSPTMFTDADDSTWLGVLMPMRV